MTTIGLRRRDPGRLAYRLIGAAAALGIVLALTRLQIGSPATPVDVVPPVDGVAAAPQLDGGGSLGLLPPRSGWPSGRSASPRAGPSWISSTWPTPISTARGQPATWTTCGGRPRPWTRRSRRLPTRIASSCRRAMVAFALHDFGGAMRRADDVLRQSPDDLAALGVAGDARLETGDIAGARERYRAAGRARPLPGVVEPPRPAGVPDRRSRRRRSAHLPRRRFIARGGRAGCRGVLRLPARRPPPRDGRPGRGGGRLHRFPGGAARVRASHERAGRGPGGDRPAGRGDPDP